MAFHTYNIIDTFDYPISLAKVKEHLKIEASDTSDDAYLRSLIIVATDFIEKYTKRDIVQRTYETFRNCFPGYNDIKCFGYTSGFELRRSPLETLTSVKYTDTDGVEQTVSSSVYYVTNTTRWDKILLIDGQSWPTDAIQREQAVKITFCAGYGEENLPEGLKQAIYMTIAHLYTSRGDCVDEACASCITGGSNAILNSFRINDIVIC